VSSPHAEVWIERGKLVDVVWEVRRGAGTVETKSQCVHLEREGMTPAVRIVDDLGPVFVVTLLVWERGTLRQLDREWRIDRDVAAEFAGEKIRFAMACDQKVDLYVDGFLIETYTPSPRTEITA
jgi:hypothetical protein